MFKKTDKKRFEELKQFSIEIKKLIRNCGRSNVISKSEIENLIIKFNIRLE